MFEVILRNGPRRFTANIICLGSRKGSASVHTYSASFSVNFQDMAKCLPFFPFFITASLVDAQKKSALATFASFKASWKAPGTKESHPIPFRLHEPWFSHLDKVGHLVLRSRLQHVLRNNVSTLYRYYIAYTYGP